MALRGIDIASWQAGLEPAQVDCQFVIVKATGGTDYVNPDYRRAADATLAAGKLLGFYHFAYESNKGDGTSEADHFCDAVGDYIGKATLWLDWEADALALPVSWAAEFMNRVKERTGVTPGIYMSKAVCNQQDWSCISWAPLWVAQYGSMDPTGWQDDPWTDDMGYGAWGGPTMFQFTGTGLIDGWDGVLDLDLFYGDANHWDAMCGTSSSTADVQHPQIATIDCGYIAARIMRDMCDDDRNGYSWGPRWGGNHPDGYKTLSIFGKDYTYPLGSYDCSSSTTTAWKLAIQYTAYAGALDDAISTHNMREVFVNSGLFEVWDTNSTSAQVGDLYLNDTTHVAMCVDDGTGDLGYDALAEFADSETGDNYNNQVGDQTTVEAYVHGFYTPGTGWNCTLHYNGKANEVVEGGGEDWGNAVIQPNPDVPTPPVEFRVKSRKGWRKPNVEGRDDVPIVGIAIDFQGHGWYQVKTRKHGWLEKVTGYDVNDDENGYAGYEDSPIIAVRAYYDTPDPRSTGYFSAKYHVSDIGQEGYYDWQFDDDEYNGQDGYAGDDNPIDKFYIELSR